MSLTTKTSSQTKPLPTLADAPMDARHIWIGAVASMEQLIGAGLSTLAGIIIPMLNLILHPELSPFMQGLAGAAGLIGIAIGSPLIGRIADRVGYLTPFRACPLLITAGALLIFFTSSIVPLVAGLFVIGLGVGGGYSLDSAYISELMPDKWRATMVGIAKASSAIGFIGVAVACYFIIKSHPTPEIWPTLSLIIASLGILTFMMRLRWEESPLWLIDHGQETRAEKAVGKFFCNKVTLDSVTSDTKPSKPTTNTGFMELFKGKNLVKVLFSGIPWACEGVGVYGVGVFLPILLIALGLESSGMTGIPKILYSVKLTAIINCFILVGFTAGLLMLSKHSQLKMLVNGFIGAAAGLGIVLAAHIYHWPAWISIAGFLFFEFTLNLGPHLITYIIPTKVFPIEERAAGNGIAAFLGKVGAIGGVFLMPALLHAGGMVLVLWACIGFNLLGALVGALLGPKAMSQN